MDWMKAHDGEPFVTGAPPTAFNRMVFSHTDCPMGETMLPGCAATVCAALELTGYKSTHDASAISYKDYGTACELKENCIIVIEHQTGNHHVTFCDHIISRYPLMVACRGGNQSHKLQVSTYTFNQGGDKILATRWPVK
jgi:hypothetical protein